MMTMFRAAAAALGVGTLLQAQVRDEPAQTKPTFSPAASSVMDRACGFTQHGDALVGGGPDYRVQITSDQLLFEPRIAKGETRSANLRFRLTALGRGFELRAVGAAAQPELTGNTARLRRPELEELYEARPEGVEQMFSLATLPRGQGDLILRGEVTTPLPAPSSIDSDGSLRFEQPGLGGVRIGVVTGIDARGARCAGALHYENGILELRLPASFVDQAVLPLLVDPLIGSVTNVASTANIEMEPDVAYDSTNAVYLVVWQYSTATDHDIRAQRVNSAGALTGGLITVRGGATFDDFTPRVANVNLRDHFVVVWSEAQPGSFFFGGFWAASVNAANGAVSAAIDMSSVAGHFWYLDVGGEATTADDDVIAVGYNLHGSGVIEINQVTVAANGALSVLSTATTTGSQLAISQSGGSTGQFLLVTLDGSGGLDGLVMDRNLGVLDSGITISTGSSAAPDVDGDGTSWLVAWEDNTNGNADRDIFCRMLTYRGSSSTTLSASSTVEGDLNDDEADPSVAWLGSSYLVGYEDESSATEYDGYVKSLDPYSCLPCEGEFFYEVGVAAHSSSTRMASEQSGGGTGSRALVAWRTSTAIGAQTNIQAQVFRADDGLITGLGGACGNGGSALATCAVVGNANFTLRLTGALASTPAWVVLGARRINAACGPCTLVPDPFTGFVGGAGSTDSFGEARVAVPIPNSATLLGAIFLEQWVITNAASPCAAGIGLSNCILVQIQ